jgi:lysine-N-methylase
LSTEGLCGLQSRHGTDGLTNVCHQYPRLQLKLDQRVERAGSLACPEIARRCLLEEDAMALERFAPDDDFTLSRPALVLRGKNDAMRTHFREVRDALIQAISQRDLHATDRLGVLLMLSNRMPKAFRAGGRVDPEELQRSLAFALDPALSAEVTPALAGIPPRGPAALTLVSFILCIFPASEGGRLADLINKLRQDCARLVELPLDSVSDALLSKAQFDALSAEYEARRDAAQSLFADRTDMYFTNYCINHLLCAPFLDQVNLRVYVEDLVVRVATLRFLFFSHPLVTAAVAQADRDAAEVTLDRAAVETFQAFAREVEHSRFYLARLRNLLVKAHAHTLGDFLCLTRF